MGLAAGLLCAACEKPVETAYEPDGNGSGVVVAKGKKFSFTLKGDFSNEWKPVTRGYLAADGKDMTDVWVLDYMDGKLVQQVHQADNTAEDFGKPVMQLAYGSHHVYFVASRGTGAAVDVDHGVITWERPADTFWKDYEVNVVSTSNGNRAVTLDRVATKLRLAVTDEVPATCVAMVVTPGAWFYGWDYVHGVATDSQQVERVVAVPESLHGTSGQMSVNIYGLSGREEWRTDIALVARDADGGVLGGANMVDVPFKGNRVTEYSGPLFGSAGDMVLALDGVWEDAVRGTW